VAVPWHWALRGLALSTGLATAALTLVNVPSFHNLANVNPPDVVVLISFGIVGGLVASRRSRNSTGWLSA
jgi:uncharacterized membrane protein YfcA